MTGGQYDDASPEVYKAVTIDMLARRYAKLPSEIINKATTMDLQIFDIAVSYENYKHKLAQGEPELTEDDMLKAIEQVRGAK